MARNVLVPATGAATDRDAFAAALAVVRAFSGHLTFLHMRADLNAIMASLAGADVLSGGTAVAQMRARFEKDIAERAQQAERMVRAFCTREAVPFAQLPGAAPVSAEWQVETGEEARGIAVHGRVSDLVAMARTAEAEATTLSLLEAAVIRTGRPILIAAERPLEVAAATVAIAWKDTREAGRAVAAALPFIEKAARVAILTVAEEPPGAAPPGELLRHALAWHNPEVTLEHLAPDNRAPGETLLERVATLRASLLVMGGYSRNRMREVIFGGFTRRVLKGAPLPVLMAR